MIDNIVLEIVRDKWIIAAYVAGIVLMCAGFWALSAKFRWTKGKIRLFGLFYGLNKSSGVCIALILGRYFFLLINAVFCTYAGIGSIVVLILLSAAINLLQSNLRSFAAEATLYPVLGVILILEQLLYGYYKSVENSWMILSMVVLLGCFVSLYGTYNLIISCERVLKKENEAQ